MDINFDMIMPSEEDFQEMERKGIESANNNPNRFSFWFPVVKALNIPCPESHIIDFPLNIQKDIINGVAQEDSLKEVIKEIRSFADKVGYPIFMKNSLTSSKHDWETSCFISESMTDSDIEMNIETLTNFTCMFLPDYALQLVVRKFIETDPIFHAFQGNMPITEEYRLFFDNGQPVSWQPYWPENAFETEVEKGDVLPSDWKEKLASIKTPKPETMDLMKQYASQVTKELGGAWSVDFLVDKNGDIFLIDMALSEQSYHSEDEQFFED